jgi:hypothetical protein
MRPALFVFTAALAAAPAAANATVLVSNLAEPVGPTTLMEVNLWASQSFVVDGSNWTLTDITTVVGDLTGDPSIVAELHDGTETGAILTTFALPSFAGPTSARTFTPLSAVTLNAGGTYWFTLRNTGSGSYGWTYALGNGQTGTGSLGAYSYSDDQGATWGVCCGSGTDNPYLFEVNVRPVAVPEPASWALMILGFAAAGSALRRRGYPVSLAR